MANLLSSVVQRITLESQFGPPVDITDPFGGPSSLDPAVQLLKPKITIYTAGGDPIVIAPGGDPGYGFWPVIKLGIAGLAVAGIWWFFIRKKG